MNLFKDKQNSMLEIKFILSLKNFIVARQKKRIKLKLEKRDYIMIVLAVIFIFIEVVVGTTTNPKIFFVSGVAGGCIAITCFIWGLFF